MPRLNTVKTVAARTLTSALDCRSLIVAGQIVASCFIIAFATTALADSGAQAGPPAIMQFVPFIFLFVVMYFLMIRPQQKRQKDHLAFLSQLKRGDDVVTASGIFGRVEGLNDQFVTLEVAPGVRIKILRSQVATSIANATSPSEAKA